MVCERKGVGGPVADERDAAPFDENDEEDKAEKKEETADAVGGRFETAGSPVDSMNAFGCVI